MRLEKYTYDVRNLGQAKRAQGWRERTDIQRTDQNACVLCRERKGKRKHRMQIVQTKPEAIVTIASGAVCAKKKESSI